MSEEEYVATLLAILTNPAPSGIDPADPYRRADDGIDRYDGFGRDVRVIDLGVVDGRYGDDLEVSFVLSLPAPRGGPPARWSAGPEAGRKAGCGTSGTAGPGDAAAPAAADAGRRGGRH